LIKGSFFGVSGLVLKPATGCLDAASLTTKGIYETATFFDDKPNQTRWRSPRVFYSY